MDTQILDKGLATLQSNKERWARLPMVEKIDYLDQTIKQSVEYAEEWVLSCIDAKGLTPQSPLSNEEWIGGPYAFLNWMQYMKKTLNKLISGKSSIDKLKIPSIIAFVLGLCLIINITSDYVETCNE